MVGRIHKKYTGISKIMKKFFPFFCFTALLILDQWSKYYIRKTFSLHESVVVIKNIFWLTYVENTGVAFGLFAGKTILFVILSGIVLIGLWYYAYCFIKKNNVALYGISFISAGAIGNMIDRISKASVTDMFDFRIWPIFNIADVAVCVGFFLLAVYMLFFSEEKHE